MMLGIISILLILLGTILLLLLELYTLEQKFKKYYNDICAEPHCTNQRELFSPCCKECNEPTNIEE